MNTGKYATVVLAAGLSSRMGDFKPLMKIGGITVADRVISLFRDIGIDVILVIGWQQEKLLSGIEQKDITIAENPDYATGMLSSVQAGVKRLPSSCESFFLMPVDIPLVRSATINRLLVAAEENPGTILYPIFKSKHGHPSLIPASLAGEILGWKEDSGLNAILARHREIQLEIPVADSNILADADDRNDFSKLLEKYERITIPDADECRAILDIAGTPDNIRRHCRKVAEIAVAVGKALVDAGFKVCMDEIEAASLLHDVARTQPAHGRAGAKIAADFGFSRIGDIISLHQDLVEDTDSVDLETKIVYIADKMVRDDEIVSVTERFGISGQRYGNSPEIIEKIRLKTSRALKVKKEIEKMMGRTIESLL